MGAGGMKLTSPQFFKQVIQLTHDVDVHLISDEVTAGFVRMGTLFASDASGVSPDFMLIKSANQWSVTISCTNHQSYISSVLC